jgi:hypothetical protein
MVRLCQPQSLLGVFIKFLMTKFASPAILSFNHCNPQYFHSCLFPKWEKMFFLTITSSCMCIFSQWAQPLQLVKLRYRCFKSSGVNSTGIFSIIASSPLHSLPERMCLVCGLGYRASHISNSDTLLFHFLMHQRIACPFFYQRCALDFHSWGKSPLGGSKQSHRSLQHFPFAVITNLSFAGSSVFFYYPSINPRFVSSVIDRPLEFVKPINNNSDVVLFFDCLIYVQNSITNFYMVV